MKKIYLSLLGVGIFAATGFAQQRTSHSTPAKLNLSAVTKTQPIVQPMNMMDTLTNHWDVIAPLPVDTAVTYSSASGFVAGQNNYGDIEKMQKFDSTYGVTSVNGSITNLLLWFGAKNQTAGTAAFTATIWADAAGVPGAVLGTAPVFTIATIDTSSAAISIIGSPTAIEGAYNVNATFSPAIAIPANQTFWAGISFTYANGDSAGLVTSRDGIPADGIGTSGNFLAASTHTFEKWSDNSFWSFNDGTGNTWQLDVALAVYPVLDFLGAVNESNGNIMSLQNSPNPAVNNTTIHYELKQAGNVSISVVDITGKQVLSLEQGIQNAGKHHLNMNTSELTSGMYFYTLNAGNTKMTSKMAVVK